MFGLTALAALMAMAFVGASSAMAGNTQLCTTDPGAGACGSPVTHVHETSVGKGKLLASITVECNVLFLSTSVGGLNPPQVLEGHLTYTSCGSCSVSEVTGTTAVVALLRTSHETAVLTFEFEIHVSCTGINCFYNGEGLVGTAKGPLLSTQANGEVAIQGQEIHKFKGLLCPAATFLDITTTPLSATYIGS